MGEIIHGSQGRIIQQDEVSLALNTIDYAHHEIHEGKSFVATKVFTIGVGLTDNVLIVVPAAVYPHFTFQAVSNAALTASLYESPDYAGGSALSSYNRNRNSTETSGLTLTTTATDSGSGLGTLLWRMSAAANKQINDIGSSRHEFILKPSTKYLVKVDGANTDVVTCVLDWYEKG